MAACDSRETEIVGQWPPDRRRLSEEIGWGRESLNTGLEATLTSA